LVLERKQLKRNTYQISELPRLSQKYKGEALTNSLFIEVLEIRRKFLETDLHEPDHFTWRVVNDFIACTKAGWVVKRQLVKVREAVIKYGADSGFWVEWECTKSLRNKQTLRLSNDVRIVIQMMDKGGLTRETRKQFNWFKKISIDFRKKLMINPLSEKQFIELYKAERLAGIYYSDLSAKENGEIWEGKEENEN